MAEFSGAKGAGANAPKKPHELSGNAILNPRPLRHDGKFDFDVPGDSMVKYNYANCDNQNLENSLKGAKPGNPAPDTHVCTPQGKPLA